ncbi:hypothetical protein AOLI_G00207900 [Acnodon oligacanthus]
MGRAGLKLSRALELLHEKLRPPPLAGDFEASSSPPAQRTTRLHYSVRQRPKVVLVSRIERVSAETLEDKAPPPQEYLPEEEDAGKQHLIKTLPDEVGTRIGQLMKAEVVQITVADEAAAEATDTMSICLEGSEDKPLDHLVSSNEDAAYAIRELLEILVDDTLSASLQPLAENEVLATNLEKTEEEILEKDLDHLVSSNEDATDAIRELLEILFIDALSASLQPLESEVIDTDLEKTKEKILEKHMDVKKCHPPEEEKPKKRKTRRGTRGKGRKIIYNKNKHPSDKPDGQGGSRGSSGPTSCGHERREVVHTRRVHFEGDAKSNDIPTLTVWRTGFFRNGANEHLRPGAKRERQTKNPKQTEYQRVMEKSGETENPRKAEKPRETGDTKVKPERQGGSRGSSGPTSCGHERREVVPTRRVHFERDAKSNDIPTLTVWRTGCTEETAAEGLYWWQDFKRNWCEVHCWAQEETGEGYNAVPFNLTYWRTGFFRNGANEHLRPGNRIEKQTKNSWQTENQRVIENPRETENPRDQEPERDKEAE